MTKFALFIAVLFVVSCDVAPAERAYPDLTLAQPPAAAAVGAPSCPVDPCFLCPPPSGLCRTTGCGAPDADGNVCYETQSADGQSCMSGVGLCNSAGDCVVPGGWCEPGPAGQWSHGCRQHIDCDDGNACTQDECGNILGLGSCVHVRVIDGTACGPGWKCVSGLCCAS